MRSLVIAWLVCVWAAATGAAAESGDRPWAQGVTGENQTRALEIFKEGNVHFEEQRYAEAIAKYREALTRWRHPSIEFNLGVSLIQIDQPAAAFEQIDHALRFGEGPLGADLFQQGKTYRKLLLGQIARLEVIAKEPIGAEVSLDGKAIGRAPLLQWTATIPGVHQIAAQSPGYLPFLRSVTVNGGRQDSVRVEMVKSETRSIARKWWFWTAIGGAAVVAAGIILPAVLVRDTYPEPSLGRVSASALTY